MLESQDTSMNLTVRVKKLSNSFENMTYRDLSREIVDLAKEPLPYLTFYYLAKPCMSLYCQYYQSDSFGLDEALIPELKEEKAVFVKTLVKILSSPQQSNDTLYNFAEKAYAYAVDYAKSIQPLVDLLFAEDQPKAAVALSLTQYFWFGQVIFNGHVYHEDLEIYTEQFKKLLLALPSKESFSLFSALALHERKGNNDLVELAENLAPLDL